MVYKMSSKKILYVSSAIIITLIFLVVVVLNRLTVPSILLSDLNQPSTHTIHSSGPPHYLVIHVRGRTETGGQIITHGGMRTKIPVGPVYLKIANEFYSQTDDIKYIPNGADQGRLKIKYKFRTSSLF